MIKITKGTTNTVALTLLEKTTIAADLVHYLFQFTNTASNASVYFIAEDISDFKSRYNLFEIVETDNPDPLAGEVELTLRDQWHYFIFEQESDSNLDPEGLTLVESGIVTVVGATTAPTEYKTESDIFTVYAPHD